jgi:hypothetical protein
MLGPIRCRVRLLLLLLLFMSPEPGIAEPIDDSELLESVKGFWNKFLSQNAFTLSSPHFNFTSDFVHNLKAWHEEQQLLDERMGGMALLAKITQKGETLTEKRASVFWIAATVLRAARVMPTEGTSPPIKLLSECSHPLTTPL